MLLYDGLMLVGSEMDGCPNVTAETLEVLDFAGNSLFRSEIPCHPFAPLIARHIAVNRL